MPSPARVPAAPAGALRSIGDVLRTVADGAYPLRDLYDYVEEHFDVTAQDWLAPSAPNHPHDPRWRHGVRSWLANRQRVGAAWPIKRAVWAIEHNRETPCCLLLIGPTGRCEQIELQVRDAVGLLRDLDGPLDAVITDPPWGLRLDDPGALHQYERDTSRVIGGYVDIPSAGYLDFSRRWIAPAAKALRSGGQLVIVTGPQAAAAVQTAAEEQGLTWIATIAAIREFVRRSTRRPAPAHWSITVMCRGSLRHPRRVFNAPEDQRRTRHGVDYPLDVWYENGRADRRGLARYLTMLPPRMTRRMVHTFTDPGAHVCDPMLGGGEVAIACHHLQRRFTGGDLNPHAVRFGAARLLAEHAWPEQLQSGLFRAA